MNDSDGKLINIKFIKNLDNWIKTCKWKLRGGAVVGQNQVLLQVLTRIQIMIKWFKYKNTNKDEKKWKHPSPDK